MGIDSSGGCGSVADYDFNFCGCYAEKSTIRE
jgi:hypothetical protein